MLIAKRNILGGAILPYKRRLAYLERTTRNDSYFDTGIVADDNTDFYIEAMAYSDFCAFFGSRSRWDSRIFYLTAYTRGHFGYGFSRLWSADPALWIPLNSRFWVKKVGKTISCSSGRSYDIPVADIFSTPSDIKMFGFYGEGNIPPVYIDNDESLIGRIYKFEISKNGEKVRSYIPVMSKEGNPEMYDEVSGTFAERHGDFLYGELDGGGV